MKAINQMCFHNIAICSLKIMGGGGSRPSYNNCHKIMGGLEPPGVPTIPTPVVMYMA